MKAFLLALILPLLFENNPVKITVNLFPKDYKEIVLKNLNHQEIKFSDQKGKVLFINFWHSGWRACLEELPSLGSLAKKLAGEKSIIFIFISDENPKKLREVLKSRKDEWQNFYTIIGGSALSMLDRKLVPTSYIFHRDNKNGYKYVGGFNWDTPEMIKTLTEFAREDLPK